MLTHPLFPAQTLFTEADLHAEQPHPLLDGAVGQLRSVVDWAREYLCAPHPELGRKGPVCPYAQGSLDRDIFYLAVQRGVDIDPAELDGALAVHRDWFRRLEPHDGPAAQFKTILLTLPDLPAEVARDVVDRTQQRLKPAYTEQGLMLGEFHDGPPAKGGLWNQTFRPLRSPVPMLVVRHMVASDLPFLADDPVTLAGYLRHFAHSGPAALRRQVAVAARRHGLDLPEAAVDVPTPRQPVNQGDR
ncbi:hypothetical protein O7606_06065 [Micromonospora sp. WMMD882]|uniref:DUF6875 domain-containing protein n=1 Tax=Micromonospora sp. WMMD882 TaxID=3015151 RepID=UPI00248B5D28|nr:hypothetical protein [Micromonospora sp. WMMD882]WBB82300.1 hypothetical protein O7606_06065 [Micromonospora sp. WMMD882]